VAGTRSFTEAITLSSLIVHPLRVYDTSCARLSHSREGIRDEEIG
jgi:hypothetical protein